jgi:predicted RNA-binding Zn-ribbon protein involved in translation (DUF1610 family)
MAFSRATNALNSMTEFKFNCPQCGQPIRCDTGYTGQQLNCPSCRQSITVPPAPARAEGVIQIKTATLRNAAIIGLGMVLVAAMVMSGLYLFAGTHKVTFKGYVDGTDIVHIRGRTLWIEHLDWQLPARITINGRKWNPSWDGNTSSQVSLGVLTRPVNGSNVKLTKRLGRGTVNIVERPSSENERTLSIKVDDGAFGGADWYEFTATW